MLQSCVTDDKKVMSGIKDDAGEAREGAAKMMDIARFSQPTTTPENSPAGPLFFTELVNDLETLQKIERSWRALAARALVANANYGPDIFLPTFCAFAEEEASKGCVLVWKREETGNPAELVGFMPLRVQRFRWGLPVTALTNWALPHMALGVPLLDADCAKEAMTAILAHAEAIAGPAGILILEEIDGAGPFAQILSDVLLTGRHPSSVPLQFERAAFVPEVDFDTYQQAHYKSKTRQTYRRKRKKLAELGTLETVFLRTWAEIEPELDAFLKLEGSGWKQQTGSALICDSTWRSWHSETVRQIANAGNCLFAALKLQGHGMLAAAFVELDGKNAGLGKIAYDEAFARFSPGGLFTLDLLEEISRDNNIRRFDSCARPDNATLYALFKQRRLIEHRVIGLKPGMAAWHFRPFAGLETLRRTAGPRIKKAVTRLRSK